MAKIEFANLPGRGIKPLVSFRAHTRAALIAFFITLLLGIPLVFIKGQVFYSAGAVVQVAPRYMKTLHDDGELSFASNTQYREFLEQQTKSVTRYDIVRDGLLSLGDKAGVWRKPGDSERRSVDLLRESLNVRSVPDTYMIEINLQSKTKDGLADVVNAVVDTYIERMRNERVFGANVRVRLLEEREAEILKVISEKTDQRTALALQLGIGAFTGREENPYDRLLSDLRESLAAARSKRLQAESQLKAFESNGETDIATRSVQEAVLIDPGLVNLKAHLYKRRSDLMTLIAGLQPAHPAFQELSTELKQIDSEVNSQTNKLKTQVQQSLNARYKTSVEQSRLLESSLKSDFDELEKKGLSFANMYNQAMTLNYDIDQQRKELDIVRERLNQFSAEENSFGFVRVVTSALPPELPMGIGKKKVLLLVSLAALFIMLAIPVVIDLRDMRIRTVNDAEKVMGIPALGWMVETTDEATQLFGTDLLRRLAGGMLHEQKQRGTRVFAFSGVKAGGGVSQLVLELAKTLESMGYPTLAVEANAFRKDSRYLGERPGLVDCLSGSVAPAACIMPGDSTLPNRVHLGEIGQRKHIDHLDAIGNVTQAWAKDFNFVLVDIPPLLLSADAEILARKLEHLIVVIEANGIISGELRRAGRALEKLDPAAIGMVVNRVRPFEGGGYLHGMILEYLSGRKLPDNFASATWLLNLQTHWVTFTTRHPVLGAKLERMLVWLSRLPLIRGRAKALAHDNTLETGTTRLQSVTAQTAEFGRQLAAALGRWRKQLIVLLSLSALCGLSYVLIQHPHFWVELVLDSPVQRPSNKPGTKGDSPRTGSPPGIRQEEELLPVVPGDKPPDARGYTERAPSTSRSRY